MFDETRIEADERWWQALMGRVVHILAWAASLIFYLIVLTPSALVLRAFRVDWMGRRPDPKVTSYWKLRS